MFRLEETRTVSNDWVVRDANRFLQLERQSHQPPARSTVQVLEDAAGAIEIRYRERRMRWTEITASRRDHPGSDRRAAPHGTAPIREYGRGRGGQSADHPWHHAVQDHEAYHQLAKDRRAWERVQP